MLYAVGAAVELAVELAVERWLQEQPVEVESNGFRSVIRRLWRARLQMAALAAVCCRRLGQSQGRGTDCISITPRTPSTSATSSHGRRQLHSALACPITSQHTARRQV